MREGRRKKKGHRAEMAKQVSPRGKDFFLNQLKGTKVQNHEGLVGEMEGEGR